MKFENLLSDDAVLAEMGQRLVAARLERRMTQAQLAQAAGVSKRTVERLEDGGSAQLSNLVRCLRALTRLEGLERLLPETPVSPIDLLKQAKGRRSRVRTPAASKTGVAEPGAAWVWGDET
jgi:transcriptional regulator with XRE-family HTH domain